jgi:hypothetical protein
MMVMLDATVMSITNATIGRELDATLADLQWVVTATCWRSPPA